MIFNFAGDGRQFFFFCEFLRCLRERDTRAAVYKYRQTAAVAVVVVVVSRPVVIK